jgi:hypothetical protein
MVMGQYKLDYEKINIHWPPILFITVLEFCPILIPICIDKMFTDQIAGGTTCFDGYTKEFLMCYKS